MQKPLLVGIAAGIAASLLLLSQASGTVMAALAPLLAPLPIAIAGLGWGRRAIVSALITALVVVSGLSFGASAQVGLFVVLFLLPIGWMAFAFGLERQSDDGTVEWFPASWNMTIALAITAAIFIIINLFYGPSEQETIEIVRNMIAALEEQQNQPIIVSEERLAEIANLMGILLLGVPPASWFLVNVGMLALAASVVRRTGNLRRPKRGLLMFQMPRGFSWVFLGGALLSAVTDGALFQIALVVVGLAGAALFLVGIAVIHFKLRNSAFKAPLLTLLYVSVFIVGFPALFILAVGWLDGLFNFRKLQPDHSPFQ